MSSIRCVGFAGMVGRFTVRFTNLLISIAAPQTKRDPNSMELSGLFLFALIGSQLEAPEIGNLVFP